MPVGSGLGALARQGLCLTINHPYGRGRQEGGEGEDGAENA